MNPQTRIREATVHDLDVIMHHRRQMFVDMGFTDEQQLAVSQSSSRGFIAQGLADGMYRGWLAEDDRGRVVAGSGIVLMVRPSHPEHPGVRRAEILNMYTEPAYRRQGIAHKLMDVMIDWCRKEGFEWVSLHASDEGRHLYESMGFKPTTEMRLKLK